jgi:integrase
MGRARTGTAQWHGNHWDIRVTLPDGTRSRRVCLPVGVLEAEARAEAARLTRMALEGGWERAPEAVQGGPTGNTFDDYADRWMRTKRDSKDVSAHLRFHILPILRDVPMAALTRADVERVVESLDVRVRAGEISWKTAQNVWATLSKMLDDAAHAKRLDLRVLERNPAEGVRGPDRGEERQSTYLFPREASALLACAAIPLHARLVYALAIYTGMRRGELAVVRVADVVLDAGYISAYQARDRVTGGTKSTKGRRARRIPIRPHLRPLLEALVQGRPGTDALVTLPKNETSSTRARYLKAHLRAAGLTREELHADDAHRRPLVFHDLRHTCGTWLAIAGVPELHIQTILGHASTEMTQRYIVESDAVGHGDIGEPFGPLPEPFLAAARALGSNCPDSVQTGLNVAKPGAGHGVRTLDTVADTSTSRGSDPAPSLEEELARGIAEASRAQRWDVVAALARELEARRVASSGGTIVPMIGRRGKS